MKKLFRRIILLLMVLTVCWFYSDNVKLLWQEATFYLHEHTETELKIKKYAEENGTFYGLYPRSLIDLLERNPETEEFVLEYPFREEQTQEPFVYDLTEGVPLMIQWDKRWGYMKYGSDVVGITGCGPVCLAMAGYYVTDGDDTFHPAKIADFAERNGYYSKGNGSSWTLISEGGEKLGFRVTELPLDENRIRAVLETGTPIIIVVGPGDFTTSGHFLVMTGYEGGQIRLLDPNSKENSQILWPYQQIQSQIKNLWSIENN